MSPYLFPLNGANIGIILDFVYLHVNPTMMTTITIKEGNPLPQKEFKNWEELRELLNFIAIQFKETQESAPMPQELKDKPLADFNYLTDESL